MKDLSLFLLKNALGAKMRKGFKNFCNGDSSTSTLDQHHKNVVDLDAPAGSSSRPLVNSPLILRESHPTLEEMILQLEMEEKIRRQINLDEDQSYIQHHRRSCVNSSDILRTARKALDQYPRFSLDGKDAMYRSSFTKLGPTTAVHKGGGTGEMEKTRRLPAVVAGESVMWCKPGVVAKLMGLEAMPIPLNSNYRRERLSAIIKRQNLRRKAERHEMERRRFMGDDKTGTRRGTVGACSRTGYCFMNPVDLDLPINAVLKFRRTVNYYKISSQSKDLAQKKLMIRKWWQQLSSFPSSSLLYLWNATVSVKGKCLVHGGVSFGIQIAFFRVGIQH